MTPKGKLFLIGGAEDKGEEDKISSPNIEFGRLEILSELLAAAKHHKIEIITTGSRFPDEVKKTYQNAFHKLHYPNPGFLSIKNRFEANDPHFLERVEKACVVFFSGGDQFRLSTILGGTQMTEVIKHRYLHDKNFVVAGTSAGAMVMSTVMIKEGGKEEALFNHDIKTTAGLGLLQNCIIDTHFIKRGRFARLAHAIIINPEQLGIGLGEDAGLMIEHGTHAECRGSGMVVIIDGRYIGQTNITEAQDADPIFVENLKVHLLVKGCRFSIKERELANPAIGKLYE
ncbi:MAG: cyanophycinase [Gammaproteobacteria bacterium]